MSQYNNVPLGTTANSLKRYHPIINLGAGARVVPANPLSTLIAICGGPLTFTVGLRGPAAIYNPVWRKSVSGPGFARSAGGILPPGVKTVQFKARSTRDELAIFSGTSQGMLSTFVVFRGTQGAKSVFIGDAPSQSTTKFFEPTINDNTIPNGPDRGQRAGVGFAYMYGFFKPAIQSAIAADRAAAKTQGLSHQTLFCGHSLGAALAQLGAIDECATRLKSNASDGKTILIAMSTPFAGNDALMATIADYCANGLLSGLAIKVAHDPITDVGANEAFTKISAPPLQATIEAPEPKGMGGFGGFWRAMTKLDFGALLHIDRHLAALDWGVLWTLSQLDPNGAEARRFGAYFPMAKPLGG